MKVLIKETTDKKFVGQRAVTDLFTITLENQDIIEISGRAHIGNGEWKLWNSNYVFEVEEIKGI